MSLASIGVNALTYRDIFQVYLPTEVVLITAKVLLKLRQIHPAYRLCTCCHGEVQLILECEMRT